MPTVEHKTSMVEADSVLGKMQEELKDPKPIFDRLDRACDPWYSPEKKEYYERNSENGGYGSRNVDEMSVLARHLGAGTLKLKNGNTVVQEWLLHIRTDRSIDSAGFFAGRKAGTFTYEGKRYLNIREIEFIKPVKGDWPKIEKFIQLLVPVEQREHFLGWHSDAIRSTYAGEWERAKMLVLIGPPGCGKSFWQKRILTGIWTTSANPYAYMSGGTSFNDPILGAVHLEMADMAGDTSPDGRRKFGTWIKKYTGEPDKDIHQKGRPMFKSPLNQRLSLALNEEPDDVRVLPPLVAAIRDKMCIFRVEHAADPIALGVSSMAEFEREVAKELPAFVWWLLHDYQPNPSTRNPDGKVDAYCEPSILEILGTTDTPQVLMELIDAFTEKRGKDIFKGTPVQTYQVLRDMDSATFDRVVKGPEALGRMLAAICSRGSEEDKQCVIRGAAKGKTTWTLRPRA